MSPAVDALLSDSGTLSPFHPFDDDDFRADLALLKGSVCEDWKRWAEQAVITARLAQQVPRHAFDGTGSTPWNSFIREIAVARRCSDQAAAKEVFLSVGLTRHPRTLALLSAGRMPLWNARVLLEESAGCDPRVSAVVDGELAERACRLSASRIRAEVRKIELRYDADAAADRASRAANARGVRMYAQEDDQASLVISGPALPVARFYESLTRAARAARQAGDPRGLDALRFDIAVDVPDEPRPDESRPAEPSPEAPAPAAPAGPDGSELPAWLGDRRRLRPVQVLVHLPVTTALGLSNEPGFVPGYGWVNAPQCRQWLTSAELRQVCVSESGFVVDLADRVVRPEPTPTGVRRALLDMVADPGPITEKTYRVERRHDPSPALAEFVDVRDLFCDGPTGTRVPAARCDSDHEEPYPLGPTAAWNLKDRSRRTHVLKHNGWTPLRTAGSTLWFSPAGQIVEVEHHTGPPPGLDPAAALPDPDELSRVDAEHLRPPF